MSQFSHLPSRSALPHPSFANAKRPLPVNGEGIEGWGKMSLKLKLSILQI